MTTMGSPFDAVMIETGKGNKGGQGEGQEGMLVSHVEKLFYGVAAQSRRREGMRNCIPA